MKFPVFDLHCDTALELLGRKGAAHGSLRSNNKHIDLLRAQTLPGYAQCFACFTTDLFPMAEDITPEMVFEGEVCTITGEIADNQDLIRLAFSPEEIEENYKNGLMSGILTIEGTAGFGFDASKLPQLYDRGFRITTLGWNEKNPLCGSHATGGGLTDQGREYIKEAQRLGMLVDVSHISDEAFWDIIEITDGPIIASHSNSRSVCNVSRNLTDEMFLAICKTGGVVGINLYTEFLGTDPDLDTVCDHILHFLSLDPSGKHVALGGDLDGCESLPRGFDGVQDYSKIAERLLGRGLNEDTVYDVFWNNAVEVLKCAVCKYKK